MVVRAGPVPVAASASWVIGPDVWGPPPYAVVSNVTVNDPPSNSSLSATVVIV